MRTKLLVAFLFCLTSSIANAEAFQANKTLICDKTKTIIEVLTKTYNEAIIWTAKDQSNESRYGLFVNPKNGTWTLVQLTPEVACILGVGEESKVLLGEKL